MTQKRIRLSAIAILLLGCGSEADPPPVGSSPLEAGNIADGTAWDAPTEGASGDAVTADTTTDAGAYFCTFDASLDAWADAERLGLPTVSVALAPSVITPPPAKSPPSWHYRKAVGVLGLSPNVGDLQAVEHILRPMGIPYQITTSPKLSIQHDMAVFFPDANPGNFTADELSTIGNYLASGGTILQRAGLVPEMNAYGGVVSGTLGLRHSKVLLTAAGKKEFPSLDRPEEQEILLTTSKTEFLDTWDLVLDPQSPPVVLATFEDATPAVVKRTSGLGSVYTFGVDWRDVVLRAQLGHGLYNVRAYINAFDPGVEAWMLMLRDIYDARVPFAVRLHTAPGDARSVAMFTHDLDWGPSYDHAVEYAKAENARGIRGTYFLHTKYITDYQDVGFFDLSRADLVRQIQDYGGAIGSHTVAHSTVLDGFTVGTGTESYPTYAPYNVTKTQTLGGTVFGELRVSKSLIDALIAGCGRSHDTISFRAGELSYNMAAPESMERLGYRFDSSRAVGDVATHYPYRQMTDWPAGADTSVFEFPITIEDELSPRLDTRAADAIKIISANADNGAPTNVLIHPNVTDYKLAAQEIMMDGLPKGVVGLDMDSFGNFWRARDAVRISLVDYDVAKATVTIKLEATLGLSGLSVHVGPNIVSVVSPAGAKLVSPGTTSALVTLPPLPDNSSTTVVLTYK